MPQVVQGLAMMSAMLGTVVILLAFFAPRLEPHHVGPNRDV